jgi:murein DD-endopeptidase MepM/ murein hydrolase activator NlpD
MITILALVGLLSAAPLGAVNADGGWPLVEHHVVAPFAPPLHDWQAGHRGVDLAATPGATVSAMVAGRVTFAGVVGGKPVVSVELDDGRRVTYEPVRAVVAVGQQVARGDVLGLVASAGGHCADASCLHVGLRTPTGYANPLGLLARRAAVLRPL